MDWKIVTLLLLTGSAHALDIHELEDAVGKTKEARYLLYKDTVDGWNHRANKAVNANMSWPKNTNCTREKPAGIPEDIYGKEVGTLDAKPGFEEKVFDRHCLIDAAVTPSVTDAYGVSWVKAGNVTVYLVGGCATRYVNDTIPSNLTKPGQKRQKLYLLPTKKRVEVEVGGVICYNETTVEADGFVKESDTLDAKAIQCSVGQDDEVSIGVTQTCWGYTLVDTVYPNFGYQRSCLMDGDYYLEKECIPNCKASCAKKGCASQCESRCLALKRMHCKQPRVRPTCPTPPSDFYGSPEDGTSQNEMRKPPARQDYSPCHCLWKWRLDDSCLNNRVSPGPAEKLTCKSEKTYRIRGLENQRVNASFEKRKNHIVAYLAFEGEARAYKIGDKTIEFAKTVAAHKKIPYNQTDGDEYTLELANETNISQIEPEGYLDYAFLKDYREKTIKGRDLHFRITTSSPKMIRLEYFGDLESLKRLNASTYTTDDMLKAEEICDYKRGCEDRLACIGQRCATTDKTTTLGNVLWEAKDTHIKARYEGNRIKATLSCAGDGIAGEKVRVSCSSQSPFEETTGEDGGFEAEVKGHRCEISYGGGYGLRSSKAEVEYVKEVGEVDFSPVFGLMALLILLTVAAAITRGRFDRYGLYQELMRWMK